MHTTNEDTQYVDLTQVDPEIAELMLSDPDGLEAIRKSYVDSARTKETRKYRGLTTPLDYLKDEQVLMEHTDYRNALKALEAHPAQYELAIYLLTNGVHDNAMAVIERDLGEKVDPGVFERLAHFHLEHSAVNHIENAIDAFLRSSGDSAAFLGALAKTQAQYRGGTYGFLNTYEKAAREAPTVPVILDFAHRALEQDNYEEALQAYKTVTNDKLTPEMWSALGECALRLYVKYNTQQVQCSEQLENAAEYFARAKNREKFMEIADILFTTYNWKRALGLAREFMPELHNDELYRHAATVVPSDETKFEIYEAGGPGLSEDAKNLWQEVSARAPHTREKMGGMLLRAGNCFKALGHTDGIKEVAAIYCEIGWPDYAHELYLAINFEPPATFYRELGDRYRNTKDLANAEKYYRLYLERNGGGDGGANKKFLQQPGDGGGDGTPRPANNIAETSRTQEHCARNA